ncbi:Major Facilitator Superfamily protein [Polystyrenella longa]|uniref:Major Facilitator Superfamily protein n=1 Tax=Polystyrenella longa TaxID=2528007 RepID=A0A518CKJ8_9PLAN|nr:MFS transporter [Polystyrenella longa]QDU79746.1 Major Facilitator Superfamily protein [Polystyrenella longa]
MDNIDTEGETIPTLEETTKLVEEAEFKNFGALIAHQVSVRVAWVFKTESVMIPAFLDHISGAGWVRGCLPILNRIGQSFAPLWLADRIQTSPRKKWLLLITTWMMGFPWVVLAILLWNLQGASFVGFPAFFLLLYTLFFAATGLNRVIFGTLQGKLIPAAHRGRLLGFSGILGSIFSVGALLYMQNYMSIEGYRLFFVSFLISGIGMLLAGLTCFGIVEPPDHYEPSRNSFWEQLGEARKILRENQPFRRLVIVSMLTITILLVFPHYQTFATERLHTGHIRLITWVIAQNIGAGVFSLILGFIADRYGNKLAIQVALVVISCGPISGLLFTSSSLEILHPWFWVTYFILGMTPVTDKAITNYTLEIVPASDHAQALSTLKLCMMVPLLFSVFVGILIDSIGFSPVFIASSLIIVIALWQTGKMIEPRHH